MPAPQPTVEATFEWRAAPLSFTADLATKTLSVVPYLKPEAAAAIKPVDLELPPHVLTETGLDLDETEAWITGQMPSLREAFNVVRFQRYEHPLLVRHRAVVTLPGGYVVRPGVRRWSDNDDDTFVIVLPTGSDPKNLAEPRIYKRPRSTTSEQLVANFKTAAEYVPMVIVRQDMTMDYPAALPDSLPRGSRVIPAHELTAGSKVIAIYRYSTGEMGVFDEPMNIASTYTGWGEERDGDGRPYQITEAVCSSCDRRHRLKIPYRCAVAVLN